jgi:hypothetical protein
MLDYNLEVDAIHVSATMSWDRSSAERLAEQWSAVGLPVEIGGPAFGDPGGEFTPGQYMASGHVITSRGCPNSCWFCDVPRREGKLREISVKEGWKVHDSNILACSREHIEKVFAMLRRQEKRIIFVGGLDASRLEKWHIDLLRTIRVDRMYFAYDEPSDLAPLREAGDILQKSGFTRNHHLYCYVLIGYKRDKIVDADVRLRQAWAAGFTPFAMLYRDKKLMRHDIEWRRFQRQWVRPAIIKSRMKY